MCLVIVGSFVMEAVAQQSKPIPVYPGAKLVIEQQEGTEPECCEFLTTDSFEKVSAFYEKQLKTKPMDTKALAAAYPAMKQQLQALEQQMPPTVKLRGFVVGELTANGQKGPLLFELMGGPDGVHFSVSNDALSGNDVQFGKEWREKTGKLTDEEKSQQQAVANQSEEDKEQKEREERRAKEEPVYRAKMTVELVKLLKQNKTDLYPGAECEAILRFEGESSSGWSFYYASKDDFKKLYDFYASRGKNPEISDAQGGLSGWSKYESVSSWRISGFEIESGFRVEVHEVSLTSGGPKTAYVAVFLSSDAMPPTLRQIADEYRALR